MLMIGLYSGLPSGGGTLLLDCSAFVGGCTLTTNERGFEGATVAIRQALIEVFRLYDSPGALYLGASSYGQIAWEGRLEDPELFAGDDGSGLTAQALGYVRALSDAPYSAVWSTTKVGDLLPINQAVAAAYVPEKWTFDTNNRLYLAPNKGENFGNVADIGAMTIETPSGGSRGYLGLQCDIEFKAPVNWNLQILVYNRDYTGAVALYTLVGTGAVLSRSAHFALGGSRDRALFQIYNNTGGNVLKATDTGVDYAKITNLRLVTSIANRVNTTMTVARAAGANVTCTVVTTARMFVGQRLVINSTGNPSESVIVLSIGGATTFNAAFAGGYGIGATVTAHIIYADEIVTDIVGDINTLNPGQLSASTGQIQSPGLDLTDELFEDADGIDVLTHLAELGDNQTPPRRWEAGVWEGQAAFFRPQLSASRAWYADATDLSVVRTLEDLANSTYAVYQDASGMTQRSAVTSDGASIARYGLTRRTAVTASTTSSVQAGVQQATALQDRKDPKPRATISFDAVYDAGGARYPLWLVRADDTMTIRNLPPNISTSVDRIRTFRVTHTSYDAATDTLAVEPEAAPRTLEVMLTRRAEGIRG